MRTCIKDILHNIYIFLLVGGWLWFIAISAIPTSTLVRGYTLIYFGLVNIPYLLSIFRDYGWKTFERISTFLLLMGMIILILGGLVMIGVIR